MISDLRGDIKGLMVNYGKSASDAMVNAQISLWERYLSGYSNNVLGLVIKQITLDGNIKQFPTIAQIKAYASRAKGMGKKSQFTDFAKCGLCQNTGTVSALDVHKFVDGERRVVTSEIFSCELRTRYIAESVDYYQTSYACKCTKGQDINSSRDNPWKTFGCGDNKPFASSSNVNVIEYQG